MTTPKLLLGATSLPVAPAAVAALGSAAVGAYDDAVGDAHVAADADAAAEKAAI